MSYCSSAVLRLLVIAQGPECEQARQLAQRSPYFHASVEEVVSHVDLFKKGMARAFDITGGIFRQNCPGEFCFSNWLVT